MLPALPEKGIPSTVDGGEPKTLSPLDTLEAHQKGAAVMAASPDGRFMATGGADGLVCLWMVYENQVGHEIPDSAGSRESGLSLFALNGRWAVTYCRCDADAFLCGTFGANRWGFCNSPVVPEKLPAMS